MRAIPEKFLNEWSKELNAQKIDGNRMWRIDLTNGFVLEITFLSGHKTCDFEILSKSGVIFDDYTGNLPIHFLHSWVSLAKDFAKEVEQIPNALGNSDISFRNYITRKTGLNFTIYNF